MHKNPKDVDALYARGWSKSMRAVYMGLVQRSFYSALRMALQARDDNDRPQAGHRGPASAPSHPAIVAAA